MNEEERKAHDEADKKATEANSNRNKTRLEQMEAIADRSDEDKPEDLADTDGKVTFKDDSEEREARAAAEDAEAAAYAKQLQTEGAEEAEVEPEKKPNGTDDVKEINGVTHYLTVVNGKERWLTLKQLRDTSQKVESADEYLRQANESVKNAARLALSKQDEPSSVEQVDVRSILRSAVLGDEEAIEKLASVLETRPSAVTPDVLRQIDQRLSFRTELASLEAKSKDLLEHPYMGRLFRDRLNELRAENANMGLSEAYTSIDTELRGAFSGLLKTKPQDKLERKRTLVNVPTAAGRQQTEPDEEGEEDVQAVIDKMAKLRGQAQAVPHPRTRQ